MQRGLCLGAAAVACAGAEAGLGATTAAGTMTASKAASSGVLGAALTPPRPRAPAATTARSRFDSRAAHSCDTPQRQVIVFIYCTVAGTSTIYKLVVSPFLQKSFYAHRFVAESPLTRMHEWVNVAVRLNAMTEQEYQGLNAAISLLPPCIIPCAECGQSGCVRVDWSTAELGLPRVWADTAGGKRK